MADSDKSLIKWIRRGNGFCGKAKFRGGAGIIILTVSTHLGVLKRVKFPQLAWHQRSQRRVPNVFYPGSCTSCNQQQTSWAQLFFGVAVVKQLITIRAQQFSVKSRILSVQLDGFFLPIRTRFLFESEVATPAHSTMGTSVLSKPILHPLPTYLPKKGDLLWCTESPLISTVAQ